MHTKLLNMRQKLYVILLVFSIATCIFQSCSDNDSYAEKREQEKKQIQAFLKRGALVIDRDSGDSLIFVPPVKAITESQFYANDSITDVAKNEYVLFAGSGVYMQIVRKGSGNKLQNGESSTVICRYTEFNIATDSIQTSNNVLTYEGHPDIMTVQNSFGTITGTFASGVMKSFYGSSVPTSWLIPLQFINLGRQISTNSDIAKVRLIVPSTQGQSNAALYKNIYPCYYEITYQRGR